MSKTSHLNLQELFTEHAQGLLLFIRRKVNSYEDAEDIAQNAFIRIQRISEQNEIDNPKAYLYQTAANLAIDMHRKNKLRQNYVQQRSHLPSPNEANDTLYYDDQDDISPERLLNAQRELDIVEKAIDSLNAQCKQAFLMHRLKGLSYNDIACIMGVSVSSVEKYILQALKQSRRALQGKAS